MSGNFTVDNDTAASNPGNAKLKPLVWFAHHPLEVGFQTLTLIVVLCFSFTIGRWFNVFALMLIVMNIFYWIRKKEHFKSGDSNGGLVLSRDPTMVAVATNLSKGIGSYPIVKVIECKPLKNAQVGDRIPTVALYDYPKKEEAPYWGNFYPIPLSYATDDKTTLQAAMDSYGEGDWLRLQEYIKDWRPPYKAGLYKIYDEESNWQR